MKDKLLEMYNELTKLKDEVYGYDANNLKVEICSDISSTIISSNQDNKVYIENGINIINIQMTNISEHSVKLYPILAGSRDIFIDKSINSNKQYYEDVNILNATTNLNEKQRLNQFIYFRSKDAWDESKIDNLKNRPVIKNNYQLCINSDSKFDYLEVRPKESILVPIHLDFTNAQSSTNMQFTIKTSLYSDPTTYQVEITNEDNSLVSQIQKSQNNLKNLNYKTVTK